jgi:hypothetical protein
MGTLLKSGDFSRRMTEASLLAQWQIEQLTSADYLGPSMTMSANCGATPTATLDPLGTINALGQSASSGPIYNRSWTICPSADTLRKRVEVTVTWDDAASALSGQKHTVVVSKERGPAS